MTHEPAYLALFRSGELARRALALREAVRACALCPRRCGVDRTQGGRGYCRAGETASVSSCNAHHGEEPPISGTRGSGTVFFAHCTMRCVFCQNYPLSQLDHGRPTTDAALADAMLALQRRGCHNVNFVTPTHFVHCIVSALETAVAEGFRLPLVYNTSGYESVETLRLLEGVIDVYLPDVKYMDADKAKRYSDAPDYPERNIEALREMRRQVGLLEVDAEGVARRGLLVRHLVLPGSEMESVQILERLAREVSPNLHLSLMSQYFPAHRALETPPLDHRVEAAPYRRVAEWVEASHFEGWVQPAP